MSSSSLARTGRGRCVIPGWARFIAAQIRASWPATHEPLDLPTITIGPLMSDDDVAWHSDMLELRAILDELHHTCIDTGQKIRTSVKLVDAHRISIDWDERGWRDGDWVMDGVPEMLAMWRAQRDVVAA